MRDTVRYYNAQILRGHKIVRGELWVSQGRIILPRRKADSEVDVKGLLISPGFIDLQVNGGFGKNFSSEPGWVREVAGRLPRYGVTSFLPTIISSSKEQYHKLLPDLQPRPGGLHASEILGIHLEGPLISEKKRGIHPLSHILNLPYSKTVLEDLYGTLKGVRMVTLAPEIPDASEFIKELVSKGIVVAAGHSEASCSQLYRSVDCGLTMVTHLFNAMRSFHHRDPGIIGGALVDRRLHFSIINDGVHLSDEAVRIAWESHPEGLILVTDGMAAMGLGQEAPVADTKILAGGIATMDCAVRRLCRITGCSIVQALETASLRPAEVLGIETRKGSLQVGADADFIVLDDEWKVQQCYVAGEKAFSGANST